MSETDKREKRNITELRPHPLQAELFPDLSDYELEVLADDINRNGLQQPVEILSDGILICGHQRVRAARKLVWKTIDVIIRSDLEKKGPAAVETRLIEDNANRRQLDRLSLARCIEKLYELYEPDPDPAQWQPRGDIRDLIGKRLGISGREVSRYQRVLKAPIAVQEAFQQGKLSLVVAGKVADLGEDARQEISDRLSAREDARLVVESYLHNAGGNHKRATVRYRPFVERLKRAFAKVPNPAEQVESNAAFESTVEFYEKAIYALQGLLRWETEALRKRRESDPDC